MKHSLTLLITFFILGFANAQGGRDVSKIDKSLQVEMEASQESQHRVVVIMANQYDTRMACRQLRNIDRSVRREILMEDMKDFAVSSQSEILGLLGSSEYTTKINEIKPFWIFNGFSCKADVEMINLISTRSDVAYIEYAPDVMAVNVMSEEDTQELPERGLSWNITKVNADDVWAYNGTEGYTGRNVTVAIIDSGVRYDHPDIEDNLWDGGSSYPHHGYDFVNSDNNPMDDNGHGTLSAGVVAGDGTEGTQTGVAPGAKIMALKAVGSNGSANVTNVCNAVQFALEHGADVINVAIEMPATDGVALRNSFQTALAYGVVAVAPAGDKGADLSTTPIPNNVSAPGNCPPPWHNPDQALQGGVSAVISVGATNKNDLKAPFSSVGPSQWYDYPYGNGATGLVRPDVVAPGVGVSSLWIDQSGNYCYRSVDGSSLASSTVAGVVALMLEAKNTLTPVEIDSILEISAVKCGGMGLKNNFYGAGRVDALAAVNAIFSTVFPPTNVAATLVGNDARITWTASSTAVSYNIYKDDVLLASNVTGTEYYDEGLSWGSHYYCLKSKGFDGQESTSSNYAAVTVAYPGPVVSDFSAEVHDGNNVALSWTAPESGTGTLAYGTGNPGLGGYGMGTRTYWAQKYPSSTLIQYAGMAVKKISFYANIITEHNVKLYKGDINGITEQIYSTNVTPSQTGWQEITLDSPIVLDCFNDLWIVCSASHTATQKPARSCTYPNNENAIYISSDGNTWTTAATNQSWLMKMDISHDTYKYNLYCNDALIGANMTSTSYDHTNLAAGVYRYYVKTKYFGLESEATETISLPVNIQFTVTFNAGGGSCEVPSMTEASTGSGVVLPCAYPSTPCADFGYEFAGWSETSVSETEETPTLFHQGMVYHLYENKTLYAVYRKIVSGEVTTEPLSSIAVGDVVYLVSMEKSMEANGEFESNHALATPFEENISALCPFVVRQGSETSTFAFEHDGSYLASMGANKLSLATSLNAKSSWTVQFDADANAEISNSSSSQKLMYHKSGYFAASSSSYGSTYFHVNLAEYHNEATYVYDSNPNCMPVAETPVISPEPEDIHLAPVEITMSCATEGAVIRYTLDGSTPSATSQEYTGPFTINATTTVTAMAFRDGYDDSEAVSQTYVFPVEYATIAAFKASTSSEIVRISGDVTAVYQSGDYLYVQDATAGLLIHDASHLITRNYANGDVISGGIYGIKVVVNSQVMFVPVVDMAAGTPGSVVSPVETTVAGLLANYGMYDSRLVKITDVYFDEDYTFGSGNNTTGFTQNGSTMSATDFFGNLSLTVAEGQRGDVAGFVGTVGEERHIYPRFDDDFMLHAMVSYTVTFEAFSGTCDTEALTEDTPESGVVLPEAAPSPACVINGYRFLGWSETVVAETGSQIEAYEAGSVYHPKADCTLYAVYAKGGEWVSITDSEDLEDGDYVVAFNHEDGWFYLPHTGIVDSDPAARPMTVTGNEPSAKVRWTLESHSSGYYIKYTENGSTYYLEGWDNVQGIYVASTASGEWHVSNNAQYGMVASFAAITNRCLAVRSDYGAWRYYPLGSNYKGFLTLFTVPAIVYDSNPECQAETVATPVFENVPEGPIAESEYIVKISCATEGASIYYTTDGTQPDDSSTPYPAEGFTINRSCTVQAIAYAEGYLPSEIAIQDFEFESVTQTTSLSSGWNWYSTYIEMDGVDGLSMMEEGLGESGEMIKSRDDGFVTYSNGNWAGTLNAVSNESMYMVKLGEDVELSMTGVEAQVASHPITLNSGWNWIGYPLGEEMPVGEALSGLSAVENDVLKSRDGFLMYSEIGWVGSWSLMEPGCGYMYKSNNSEDVQFVYGGGKGEALVELLDNEVGHYEYDIRDFANSMTMVVSVVLDGETVAESGMEIGAFVDGECRGGAKIQRVGDTGRYEAFLMIYGEYGDEVGFRLYDGNGGMEYEAEEEVRFVENDSHGSVKNPYMMQFGTLGAEEDDARDVVVYPNPTNGVLRVECGAMRVVSVVNAMGQVVYSEEVKADECVIEMGGFTPGVYMVNIYANDGAVITKRVTVIR